jgi:hypothetical protein
MVFELVTGDLLFDPHEGDGYDRDEGQNFDYGRNGCNYIISKELLLEV